MEKKQEIKKPSSSILIGKAHLKSVLKPSTTSIPSLVYGSSSQPDLKSVLKPSSSINPSHVYGTSSQQEPSMLVQSQMAARVEFQIDASKLDLPKLDYPSGSSSQPDLKSVLKPSSSINPSNVYGSSSQPDPSMLVQSQMAARVEFQIDAPKFDSPKLDSPKLVVPSEDIELPEINSEYSDSEDEDRVRTFNPPEWAQSPELRQALEMQSTMNPDDIFGAVRPLRMEEIFKSRTSRFRARTSSANWTGTDRLTMKEQGEYARRMGFK
jgi:hypothetical protein